MQSVPIITKVLRSIPAVMTKVMRSIPAVMTKVMSSIPYSGQWQGVPNASLYDKDYYRSIGIGNRGVGGGGTPPTTSRFIEYLDWTLRHQCK